MSRGGPFSWAGVPSLASDFDAEEIQKERERRRSAERLRISRDREARSAEAARLRSVDAGASRGPAARRAPPSSAPAAPRPSGATSTAGAPSSPATPAAPPRTIGGPILSPELRAFFDVDPTDRFDLQEVNALRLGGLVRVAAGDGELLRALAERAATLMARVKQEADDPLNAGAFLRERVLEWYRASPTAERWTVEAPARWSGVLADSRTAGGKLHPWVNHRLRALRDEAARAGPVGSRLRQGLRRDRRDREATSRTAHQQILAEVAQAVLDDLGARRREPGVPCPLVHLSELAMRRQVATVNDALAALFGSPESGPFVVLHPNRYPECEELSIRPPLAAATGAALAYRLVPGTPSHKGARGRAGSESADGGLGTGGPEEEDGASLWEAAQLPPEAWPRAVEARRRDRRRLDSPPKDYRQRAAYEPLRELVVRDPEFRKQFLAVRWRGRPAGLPLLATLLQRGKLAPEVATDHEYLDAELDGLVGEDAAGHPSVDVWRFAGWTVRREGGHAEGFRYVAERDDPGSAEPEGERA